MTSLVIAEHDNASIKGATLNTVTAAAAIGGDVHVLVAGEGAQAAAAAAAQIAGVSKVIHADGASLKDGLAENLAAQVLAIAGNYSHILFPATASGKNAAPRVAAKLDVVKPEDLGVDVAPRIKTLKVAEPAKRGAGVKVPDVATLVEKLKNEAKVI